MTLTALWLLAACQDPVTGSGSVLDLDRTQLPVWRWEVALTIGNRTEEGHDLMGPIPIGEDSRGNIYIADPPAREIKRFDPRGIFVRNVVQPGEGPSEMRFPPHVYGLIGDTLWFGEFPTGRVQFVIADGTSLRVEETGLAPGILGVEFIAYEKVRSQAGYWIITRARADDPDAFRPNYRIRLFKGTDRNDMTPIHDWNALASTLRFHGGRTHVAYPAPFDHPIILTSPDGGSFLRIDRGVPAKGDMAVVDLRRFDSAGKLLHERTLKMEPVEIPRATRDSFEVRVLNGVSMFAPPSTEERRRLSSFVASIPNYYPGALRAFLGPEETVWLRIPGSGMETHQDWLVLDDQFNPLALSELPSQTGSVSFLPGGGLWAVMRGEFETAYVARLRLHKAPLQTNSAH